MIDILLIAPEITKGMKSVGSKCLLSLRKNLTLIEYQISQFQKIKPARITLNLGLDSEKIISKLYRYKTINYLINNKYETTNQSANLISYIKKYRPSGLLIFSSGLLIKNNIIVKKDTNNGCKLFVLNKSKNNFDIGCSNMKNPDYLFYNMPETWAEICYLDSTAIDILFNSDEKIFQQMYLFEAINFLLQKNIVFEKIYLNKNNIMKVQTLKDLPSAKTFI